MTNFGQPIIRIEMPTLKTGRDATHHMWEGIDMQPDFMTEAMKNLYAIWTRPINLTTVMDGEGHLYRFDGKEFSQHKIQGPLKAADSGLLWHGFAVRRCFEDSKNIWSLGVCAFLFSELSLSEFQNDSMTTNSALMLRQKWLAIAILRLS